MSTGIRINFFLSQFKNTEPLFFGGIDKCKILFEDVIIKRIYIFQYTQHVYWNKLHQVRTKSKDWIAK